MAIPGAAQIGVSLAIEAHRRRFVDDAGLDLLLAYYGNEGATAPAPPDEVLARLGGLDERQLREVMALRPGGADPRAGHERAGEAPPAHPGHERLSDRITLLARLGEGGMGTVHRAWDSVLRRVLAVKIIREDKLAGESGAKLRARFEREARAMARVRHPACVAVHDVGVSDDGRPYLVMDLVEGQSLQARLHAGGSEVGVASSTALGTGLDPRQVAAWGRDLAEALQACHDVGVIHRDVKPANVLVDPGGKVHLTDFGVAQDHQAQTKLTVERGAVGTLAYMPPEQAVGDPAGPRSDVYALGATLFECLCGAVPFEAQNGLLLLRQIVAKEPPAPRTLRKDVPPDLDTIILACLAKEPSDRYASAQALALDLARFLADEPILARPTSPLERLARRLRRHGRAVGAISTLLVLALGASITGAITVRSRERAALLARIDAAAVTSDRAAGEAELAGIAAASQEAELTLRATEALRVVRARRRLDEAIAAIDSYVAGRPALEAMRMEAAQLEAAITPITPVAQSPEKQRLREVRRGLDRVVLARELLLGDAQRLLAQAELDLPSEESDAVKAQLLLVRAQDLARTDPAAAEAIYEETRAVDARSGGRLAAQLEPAQVSLASKPSSTVVISRYRFDPHLGYMVPAEVSRGTTPLALDLPGGEYLLEFSASNHLAMRRPVLLRRGEAQRVAVELPATSLVSPLADLVVAIPAGVARWGPEFTVQAPVNAFLIRRTEVTLEEWLSFMISEELPPSFSPAVATDFEQPLARPDRHVWPVSAITWDEAEAYTQWLQAECDLAGLNYDVRLPTVREFHWCLRGELPWIFPWGREYDPSFVFMTTDFWLANQPPRPNTDRSPMGVDDLAGVVAEFAEDRPTRRIVVVGGSYLTQANSMNQQLMLCGQAEPDFQERALGFRYVLIPRVRLEPRSPRASIHPSASTQRIGRAPGDALAWLERGRDRLMLADPWGTIWDANRALQLAPRSADAFALRGLGLRLRGTLEPALDDFERALALDPGCAEARYGRGLVRVARGDRGGPADLERALEDAPGHALAAEARSALDELRRR